MFLKLFWPLLALLAEARANDMSVYLSFNGTTLPNNSYITVDMIGTQHNNALICHTNHDECCHQRQTVGDYSLGEWRYPNGSIVHYIDIWRMQDHGPTYVRNRNHSIVRLMRFKEPKERGQFCCRIPDANDVNHTLCSHIVDAVPFTISVQPGSQYVARGENATFSVGVKSTTNLFYQWLKDGNVIQNRLLKYSGVTKSILVVQNVSLQDEGIYRCVINDHTGFVLSDQASLCLWNLNNDTINCLCLTGISKELCEAKKSAGDNLEKLSRMMANITEGKLHARDISFATTLLEGFGVVSFLNEVIRENFLTIIDNIMLSNGNELITSQTTSNSSLRVLACLDSFLDHAHVSNHSDSTALTIFTQETFVLLINDNSNMRNTHFNMEHSDKQITLTTSLNTTLLNITTAVTAVIGDSVFENLQGSAQVFRISYSIFLKDDLFLPLDREQGLTLQSIVFGVRVNDTRILNLSSPIEVYFQTDEFINRDGKPLCGRWNTSHYGVWDAEVCQTSALNEGNTNGSLFYKTSFTQFGHFGLLLDFTFKSNPLPESYSLALAVISYFLLTVSTLCLIIFIVTYLTAKQLRSNQHGQILINLSLSLLFLYLGFLIAAHATPVPILCGISATLLQYFMLVYFGWTSVEAFFLYRNLVKVLLKNVPKFVLKAALLVYFSSLMISALSAGPGYKSYPYHTQKSPVFLCRVNYLPFWLGQILPFIVMNIFNWSLFITIIISVCLKRRTATDEPGKKAKKLTKSHVTMTIGLANLCGLGWIFGLAASSMPVEELTFIFQLLFSIFVGSQGILLFFFHCIRNPQARKQWKTWFTNARRVYSVIIPSASTESTKTSMQMPSSPLTVASIGKIEGNY